MKSLFEKDMKVTLIMMGDQKVNLKRHLLLLLKKKVMLIGVKSLFEKDIFQKGIFSLYQSHYNPQPFGVIQHLEEEVEK